MPGRTTPVWQKSEIYPHRFSQFADHHFGRLDDRHGIVAAAKAQRTHGVGGDDRGQALIADAQPDLGEQAVDPHFLDESPQSISRTQFGETAVVVTRRPASGRRFPGLAGTAVRLPARRQALDLRLGNTVVAAFGPCGPDFAGGTQRFSVEYPIPSWVAASRIVSNAMIEMSRFELI